jgi:hypothetical protein
MFDTICDINRLNYSNPFFYSEKYLRNEYVKANDLAKHIHLFNHQITRIDYSLFSDLKGFIHKLAETEIEKTLDEAQGSNPLEIKNTIYTFNQKNELYQVLTNKHSFQETILFSDSMKMPKRLRIIESFDNINSSQTDITYNDFLEYEAIEEKTFYNDKRSNWVKPNQRNTKYVFKENDGLIYKIHIRNNKDEQSKTIIIYNNSFQILESKTYSQRNKTELLYEAIFNYDEGKLKEIVYIRHKPSKVFVGNSMQKIIFGYDEKGLLINFKNNSITKTWTYDQNENPISIKEIDDSRCYSLEVSTNYEYDTYNNWTYKETKTFIDKVKKNDKQVSRKIEYF